MYPVTHMTIAVGAVRLGEKLVRRLAPTSAIDYRFAALGSQIPDLIDKPLARLGVSAFSYTETSGHAFGHTLLVPVCMILIGALLARRGDARLLVLGVGCLTHPLVDPTNTHPRILFWPAFGWSFWKSDQEWRTFVQIPLDISLASIYTFMIWRSERWRNAAFNFIRTGAFPVPSTEVSGKQT